MTSPAHAGSSETGGLARTLPIDGVVFGGAGQAEAGDRGAVDAVFESSFCTIGAKVATPMVEGGGPRLRRSPSTKGESLA